MIDTPTTDALRPDNIVELRGLTRRFGDKLALDRVTLSLPRGSVLGLVGANGAGKTTLIKHVLGLLRAQAGSVRVFGRDPTADPVGVLARIGYLAEENDLPGWRRVSELCCYLQAFYPNWDEVYAKELQQTFELDAGVRIRNLSKGQRARVGLLAALAHRPELLVLDEPSSGLDPIVRRDILSAIIRTIADEGRTVLFSSHLLHEVERVADSVAMIHRGRLVFSAALDDIKETHRCLTLRFAEPRSAPPALDSALTWEGASREWTALCGGADAELRDAAARVGADIIAERVPSLGALLAWTLFALLAPLWLLCFGTLGEVAGLLEPHFTDFTSYEVVAIIALALIGLWALTWGQAVAVLTLTITGRGWIVNLGVLFYLMIASLLIVIGRSAYLEPAEFESRMRTASWCASFLLALKLLATVGALADGRRTGLLMKKDLGALGLWLIGTTSLVALVFWLVPTEGLPVGTAAGNVVNRLSVERLALLGVLAMPIARLMAAPRALYVNRVR